MIYKIVVDKQPMTNPSEEKREYEIDIEELRFKRDVYDSLVITLNEDYVMRRLELGEYNVLTELNPPIKEPLPDLNIELFEGDNYIYLYDMTGNRIVAQYLVKNEFNELYITQSEMNSAIEQSAKAIELSVNGKIARVDGDIEDLSANLELKVDKNDNDQVVSMINASADEIKLKSNRLIIDSTNFKLNDQGNITATGGTIGGFTLGSNSFEANLVSEKMTKYTYTSSDMDRIRNIIVGNITPTSNDYDKYDFDNSGSITIMDFYIVQQIIAGNQSGQAKFELNTKSSEKAITIKNQRDVTAVNMGLFGSYINRLSANTLRTTGPIYTEGSFVYHNEDNNIDIGIGLTETDRGPMGYISLTQDANNTISMYSKTGNITCRTVTQTSKEEEKKNFEKLDNGLDIVKNTDIYKYNFKTEEDDGKKHIGFVIGKDYKYSSEITAVDDKGKEIGVDVYSMVAVAYKAIQEQQEQIEKLQKENQQKDEILANLIERLEKLEKEGQIC